jgi:catechol 2,3-dioxygenase-like lactoylglutathione lyase family enzyme
MIVSIEHVQLAMPRGKEGAARSFYSGVLGLAEVEKPMHLRARGGAWFESGSARVHLGVEDDFCPARKAHPAFLVQDLAALLKRCEEAGVAIVRDEPLAGYERRYLNDPFGNRIELMEKVPT